MKIEDRLYEFIVKSIPDHAMRTVNFYLENRVWLEEVVIFVDDYSQTMAIEIIKKAKKILNQN